MPITLALAGNPNCGKTTIFNALTGARRHVGNWPGVTVERRSGFCEGPGGQVEVVDLPGGPRPNFLDHQEGVINGRQSWNRQGHAGGEPLRSSR